MWAAGHAYRRGKPREPVVAAFDLDSDLVILAPHRDLAAGTVIPSHRGPSSARRSARLFIGSLVRDSAFVAIKIFGQ